VSRMKFDDDILARKNKVARKKAQAEKRKEEKEQKRVKREMRKSPKKLRNGKVVDEGCKRDEVWLDNAA
jgi:hypothetical protein